MANYTCIIKLNKVLIFRDPQSQTSNILTKYRNDISDLLSYLIRNDINIIIISGMNKRNLKKCILPIFSSMEILSDKIKDKITLLCHCTEIQKSIVYFNERQLLNNNIICITYMSDKEIINNRHIKKIYRLPDFMGKSDKILKSLRDTIKININDII